VTISFANSNEFYVPGFLIVRDEASPASDVDLPMEFDGRPVGLFHLSRTQHYLESILGVARVELVLCNGIKPALKERILSRKGVRSGKFTYF
jgi:predicted nucleotidyltransferase